MNVYLDASALVSIFVADSFSARIDSFLESESPEILISNFAAAEVISAIGLRVRIGDLSKPQARAIFRSFDAWKRAEAIELAIEPLDVLTADNLLRRLDLTLRTPDALHIAVANRLGSTLVTFDKRLADCARAVGATLAVL